MYITVYFDNKPVFLCDSVDEKLNEYLHHPDTVFIDEISNSAIKSLLHEIEVPAFHAGVLQHDSFEELKKAFFKNFTPIAAAGGLVLNEKGQLLMMLRRGKWDLPKGKCDEGESMEECALREVSEETGVHDLKIIRALAPTYHTYHAYGKHMLKTTSWFLMQASSNALLTPQTEEDITALEWVNSNAIPEKMKESFKTIEAVIQASGILSA